MNAKLIEYKGQIQVQLENGTTFDGAPGISKDSFIAEVTAKVQEDFIDEVEFTEVNLNNTKRTSTSKIKNRLADGASGLEVDLLNSILIARGVIDNVEVNEPEEVKADAPETPSKQDKAEAKAAEKAAKDKEKAEAKAAKDAEKAAAKEAKDKEKAEAKAKKDAEKAEKAKKAQEEKEAKAAAKAAAKAERDAKKAEELEAKKKAQIEKEEARAKIREEREAARLAKAQARIEALQNKPTLEQMEKMAEDCRVNVGKTITFKVFQSDKTETGTIKAVWIDRRVPMGMYRIETEDKTIFNKLITSDEFTIAE